MTTTIRKATCGRHTIRIKRVKYTNPWTGQPYEGFSYCITGQGLQHHTLHSARTTAEECWDNALLATRKMHPRAKVHEIPAHFPNVVHRQQCPSNHHPHKRQHIGTTSKME